MHTRAVIVVLFALSAIAGGTGTVAAAPPAPQFSVDESIPREGSFIAEIGIERIPNDYQSEAQLFVEYRSAGTDEWQQTTPIQADENAINSISVEELLEGTTYEWRAVMTYDGEEWRTGAHTVTTEGAPPDFGSPDITSWTISPGESSATFDVRIGSWQHAEESVLYVRYWETGGGAWQWSRELQVLEHHIHTVTVDGLESGTEYEAQAVVEYRGEMWTTDIVAFTASESSEPKSGGDGGILSGVVSVLRSILDAIKNLGSTLKDAIIGAFTTIFKSVAQAIVDFLTAVITTYPQVHPNEDVTEIHQKTFLAALALSGIAFAATGLLYITGPIFGIQYHQLRVLFPRIVVALVFGAVAPMLLQYSVDLASALTIAFKPADPELASVLRLGIEMALIWFVYAFLLLGIAVVFVVRDVYILFAAAAAPIIALMWAMPYTRRYASSLIDAYWAFLLIGPLDMIVFNLTLSLLETDLFSSEIPHWILAIGGFLLMLGLPIMLLGAANAAVGLGFGLVRRNGSGTSRNTRQAQVSGQEQYNDHDRPSASTRRRVGDQMAAKSGSNRFDKDVIIDDDH